MRRVDLRSDTVTRPTQAMREAMAAADVGDDVYGEDPSVRALEERVAHLLGKERALFVPSGTMANQIALLTHTSRGDEVYVGAGAHCAYYESGAGGAIAGVQFVEVGRGGLFTADELSRELKGGLYWEPQPRLVVIENTHNRAGGRVFPQAEVSRIATLARARGLALHLDGARLWNAAIATNLSPRELAAPFDTVSVCFSKGLGAPVGSAIVGSHALVSRAHRFRKMLGGGMRQAGILARGAEHALDNHRARLEVDHENARAFAARLVDGGRFDVHTVETNIVLFDTPGPARKLSEAAAARGVLCSPFAERRIRVVTHLDVSREDVEHAASVLLEVDVALDRETPTSPESSRDAPASARRT